MKGITFSGELISKVLDGTKTHTRRRMNPQPINSKEAFPQGTNNPWFFPDAYYYDKNNRVGENIKSCYNKDETVYMKEIYCLSENGKMIMYKADNLQFALKPKWKSPMFMPERLSRQKLFIKNVWPEQIQGISKSDIRKEGCPDEYWTNPFDWWIPLWDKLHPGSWEKNEWVWVYEFNRI